MGHKDLNKRKLWYDNRRRQTRQDLIEYKSKPCHDCGGSFPHYVMDFDHVPERGKKFATVSELINNRRITAPKVVSEIAKCDLVCANCHKVRTWMRKQENRNCQV